MSGLQACEAIRSDPSLSSTPVILLTARAQEADVDAGMKSGADEYLTKPFSPRELATRVEALLAGDRG
jgi:DNA-binding response OmpR family regulator